MMNQLVCRCCLLENPTHTHNIFEGNLRVSLLECVPPGVHIEPHDGLPEVICDRCWLHVCAAVEFRRCCCAADLELRRRYEDANKAIEQVLGSDMKAHFEREVDDIIMEKLSMATEEGLLADSQDDTTHFEDMESTMLNDLHDMLLEDNSFSSTLDSGYGTTSYHDEEAFLHNIFKEIDEAASFESDLICTQDSQHFMPGTESDFNYTAAVTASYGAFGAADIVQQSAFEDLQTVAPQQAQGEANVNVKSLHACPECDKRFTRNFQLKLHLISVHNLGNGLQYNCSECHKVFASRHSLNYHQKSMHSTERPYACEHCARRFILRSQLVSHTRMHTGEFKPRVFQCSGCGKYWPTRGDLRTHMRTHNPHVERPYKCASCEKSFFTRGHLSSHMLVHTGQKPYTCIECGKCYQSIGNLNNHLVRRHGMLRPQQSQQQQPFLQQQTGLQQLQPLQNVFS